MYNKIDKRLLSKINILSNEKCVDVIVKTIEGKSCIDVLKKYSCSDIEYFSIINAYSFKTKYKNLFDIASKQFVKYVSGECRVCGLVYKSKKTINFEYINAHISRHTCVVIDTGVYPHIDFCLGRNRIIKFIDLINQNKYFYDDNGHGTFITGILSSNSFISINSGIDNSCDIIVIKALDKDGETASSVVLSAMQWILENMLKFNIRVVCMSFGSDVVDGYDPLVNGAEVLWDNGIVVVTAGGNSGPEPETIMSPGASRKVITVGSMRVDNGVYSVADFSSRGPVFGNVKPDLVVPGVDLVSTNVFSFDKQFYTTMSGTSVSAPIVAGVASKLISINPNYTPNQIKYMILNSCVPINCDKNSEGYGRLDLSKLRLI